MSSRLLYASAGWCILIHIIHTLYIIRVYCRSVYVRYIYIYNYCAPQTCTNGGEIWADGHFFHIFIFILYLCARMPNVHTKHRSTSITPSAPSGKKMKYLHYIVIDFWTHPIEKKRRGWIGRHLFGRFSFNLIFFFFNSKTVETQTQTRRV
jgi:hypothetical protein